MGNAWVWIVLLITLANAWYFWGLLTLRSSIARWAELNELEVRKLTPLGASSRWYEFDVWWDFRIDGRDSLNREITYTIRAGGYFKHTIKMKSEE